MNVCEFMCVCYMGICAHLIHVYISLVSIVIMIQYIYIYTNIYTYIL